MHLCILLLIYAVEYASAYSESVPRFHGSVSGDFRRSVLKINTTQDTYDFYRSMKIVRTGQSGRRVFGGSPNDITDYPYVCALLDVYYMPSCSCSVLSSHWGLTAAHCLTTAATYVKYNTHVTNRAKGDVAIVEYHFRHPRYKVEYTDAGRGLDVSALHHDIGLFRTKDYMTLKFAPVQTRNIGEMQRYNPVDIRDHVVKAYGFGVTSEEEALNDAAAGEVLMSVDLRMTFCARSGWYHCVCGAAEGVAGERGVCSGDSGGPVLYRGVQVAVVSMGPLSCSNHTRTGEAKGSTSVFTALYNYVDLINATITDKERGIAGRKVLLMDSSAGSCLSSSVMIVMLLSVVLSYKDIRIDN